MIGTAACALGPGSSSAGPARSAPPSSWRSTSPTDPGASSCRSSAAGTARLPSPRSRRGIARTWIIRGNHPPGHALRGPHRGRCSERSDIWTSRRLNVCAVLRCHAYRSAPRFGRRSSKCVTPASRRTPPAQVGDARLELARERGGSRADHGRPPGNDAGRSRGVAGTDGRGSPHQRAS